MREIFKYGSTRGGGKPGSCRAPPVYSTEVVIYVEEMDRKAANLFAQLEISRFVPD